MENELQGQACECSQKSRDVTATVQVKGDDGLSSGGGDEQQDVGTDWM